MAIQLVTALAATLALVGVLLLATAVLHRRSAVAVRVGPSGSRVVRSRSLTEPGPPPTTTHAPVPDSPEAEVTRRRFLNRALLLALTVFGVAFGGSSVAMLWPNGITGVGAKINAGKLADVLKSIRSEGRYYNAEGRFYIVTYPHTDDPNNMYVRAGVAKQGIMTLYQKCAHLGCRVPYCATSEWFECPCHASKYNYAGERQPGSPAAAGLWRFPMEITKDGMVIVDTSKPTAQPPLGTDTIHQPPAGEPCTTVAEGAS